MLEVLTSELAKTLIIFLEVIAVIILWVIFHQGAIEDSETRHYYGVDKYIMPFLATVSLPHIYMAWILIDNGFLLLYLFNLVSIGILWYVGKYGVIGGADAICLIMVAICFPFVVPLVAMGLFTIIADKIMRWRSPGLDAEWRNGKIPLLVLCKYGYLCTIPIAIIFFIGIIL